jgi:hypothetical protein
MVVLLRPALAPAVCLRMFPQTFSDRPGHFQATGIRPRFLAELTATGVNFPNSFFDPHGPSSPKL